MLGIIFVTKGVHTGKEVIFGYPNSIFKDDLSYFDSIHYNSSISSTSSSKGSVLGWPTGVIADILCPKRERWDTILDFSAESFRFIGFPVTISHKFSQAKPLRAMTSLSILPLDSDVSQRIKDSLSAFNVVFAFEVDCKLLIDTEHINETVVAISNG